jgi:hypothetical protein
MSNVRALTRMRRTHWRGNGAASKSTSNSIQMQATQLPPSRESESLHWSVSERRFALLFESVNGLRFAHLNSQKVGVQRTHSPSRGSSSVRRQRVRYCEGRPRIARIQFTSVRRSLRSALFPHATSVRFGHQRPNPSVEGTAKRLRLLSAPHLER